MVGFIRGGRELSLPSCRAASVVSMVLVWRSLSINAQEDATYLLTVPLLSAKTRYTFPAWTFLSVTSESIHPSVGSGRQAPRPNSVLCAPLGVGHANPNKPGQQVPPRPCGSMFECH